MVRLVTECEWEDIHPPNDFGGPMWGTESGMSSLRWVRDGRKRDSERGDMSSGCHNRIERCVRGTREGMSEKSENVVERF